MVILITFVKWQFCIHCTLSDLHLCRRVTRGSITVYTCQGSSLITGRQLTKDDPGTLYLLHTKDQPEWEHLHTLCVQSSHTTETWGSFATPQWQSCTGVCCHRNKWAPFACPWHPSLLSHGTSWKAAWSTGSGATTRWYGGGSYSSCFWDRQNEKHSINKLVNNSEVLVQHCKWAGLFTRRLIMSEDWNHPHMCSCYLRSIHKDL